MTRQITFFKFEVGIQGMKQAEDGRYDLVRTPVCVVEATSMAKSEIRAAILEAGVSCPRGTDVYADKVGKVRYMFETADLMRICKERQELDLDGNPVEVAEA